VVKTVRLFAHPDERKSSVVGEGAGQSSFLFENSSLGVAITTSAFRFLSANPAFLNMLGYSSEQLQELSVFDVSIGEDREACRVALDELREGARLHYEAETTYQRKDGTTLPVDTYFSKIGGPSPTTRTFLLVVLDTTARGAAEDALRAAQSELTRVARLTTVGAMAGSIAHEINQPLASVVMNASAGLRWLARSEPNLEEARSAFGRIVNDGHRAAQIIAGIRAMFRKESTERSPVAVNELICDVVATSLGELKNRNVSLGLELVDDLPPVPADRVQLQQVLSNLVTNAIDSMVSVPQRSHTLTVRSERLDEWALISVRDTGTGIAPEQAERMFEAFYTTKPNGIGLGLSISRSIVESHNGRLSVLPIQPFGSVFQVLLPTGR
jgi:PAS domain S-box-containing protein